MTSFVRKKLTQGSRIRWAFDYALDLHVSENGEVQMLIQCTTIGSLTRGDRYAVVSALEKVVAALLRYPANAKRSGD